MLPDGESLCLLSYVLHTNNLYISILDFNSLIYREHKEGSLLSLRAVKTLSSFRILCHVGRTNSSLIYSTLLSIKPIHSLLEYPLLYLAKHCFTAQQIYVSSILITSWGSPGGPNSFIFNTVFGQEKIC